MDRPLAGIRVVDLGQIFAAPYCTMQLAHLGAEVIKIEPPGAGENLRRPEASIGGVSYSFLMLNANKKSVTLNLKKPRGRDLLLRLLETADILTENYSAGVMESLGLGYDVLAVRFPRLIYASIKGYGSDGPWAKLGAMDSTLQAACGLISVTGMADGPGMRSPATFIDMGSGSHLASAILAALIQRGRTGRGQRVDVAMHDVCVAAMTGLIANELEGKPYRRLGNRHRNACPSNVYPASDGEVLIFCLTETHWREFALLMGRADLLDDPRYADHASRFAIANEVDTAVADWTRTFRRDALVNILLERGLPCAPVREVAEVVADPDVARRRMLIESEYPTRGKIKVMGSPLKLGSMGDAMTPASPPPLGADTDEVLSALGLDAETIANLRADAVL